jgi:Holliday junction DNA helicase RuvB
LGLDENDRRLITAMVEKHHGGPVGLKTLSASINEDPGTIEEVLEPYLIQIAFIKRTPKGRILTEAAYQHLGLEYPAKN